jgi:hypothetical protein
MTTSGHEHDRRENQYDDKDVATYVEPADEDVDDAGGYEDTDLVTGEHDNTEDAGSYQDKDVETGDRTVRHREPGEYTDTDE